MHAVEQREGGGASGSSQGTKIFTIPSLLTLVCLLISLYFSLSSSPLALSRYAYIRLHVGIRRLFDRCLCVCVWRLSSLCIRSSLLFEISRVYRYTHIEVDTDKREKAIRIVSWTEARSEKDDK